MIDFANLIAGGLSGLAFGVLGSYISSRNQRRFLNKIRLRRLYNLLVNSIKDCYAQFGSYETYLREIDIAGGYLPTFKHTPVNWVAQLSNRASDDEYFNSYSIILSNVIDADRQYTLLTFTSGLLSKIIDRTELVDTNARHELVSWTNNYNEGMVALMRRLQNINIDIAESTGIDKKLLEKIKDECDLIIPSVIATGKLDFGASSLFLDNVTSLIEKRSDSKALPDIVELISSARHSRNSLVNHISHVKDLITKSYETFMKNTIELRKILKFMESANVKFYIQ